MNNNARLDFFKRKILLWRKNPIVFFKEVLKFEPDDWQELAAHYIRDCNKISIKSGQGVGKTAFESAIGLWFLVCFPESRVVATAPTKHQLNDVLWTEMAKWINKSPLLKAILDKTKTYIYVVGKEDVWFAVAVAAAKPENIQGFHADNMLFIVDEASGVENAMIEAILGTLSGVNNKLLLCGNPTKANGIFYESHTSDRALYKCITVNSLESKRTNKENIKAMIEKYGEDSNVVRVRVKGEFPLEDNDVFIPISLIENSIMTEYDLPENPNVIRIGCDVARFGDDKTVITQRIDKKVDIAIRRKGKSTMWTAKQIALLYKSLLDKYPKYTGYVYACIDDGGVGGGVIDKLVELKDNYPQEYERLIIVPVSFGRVVNSNRYYHDTTTIMMSILKNMISTKDDDSNEKEVEIVLPDDADMVAQLSCRKYTITDRSKIKVESKKEMKKRKLPSPDEADSVLLCIVPIDIPKLHKKGFNSDE